MTAHRLAISVQANFRSAKVMPEPESTAHARTFSMKKREMVIRVQAHACETRVTPEPKSPTDARLNGMTEYE